MPDPSYRVLMGFDSQHKWLEGELSDAATISVFRPTETPAVILHILASPDPPPNLIVLAINSPTTFEEATMALREFRACDRTKHVPIVILLAEELCHLANELYSFGAKTVIVESRILDQEGKVGTPNFEQRYLDWTELAARTKLG